MTPAPYQEKGYSERGAFMGRGSSADGRLNDTRAHLHHVRLDSQGYDAGGAYWGHGAPIYCAFADGEAVYVRAGTREQAKSLIREMNLDVKFYR